MEIKPISDSKKPTFEIKIIESINLYPFHNYQAYTYSDSRMHTKRTQAFFCRYMCRYSGFRPNKTNKYVNDMIYKYNDVTNQMTFTRYTLRIMHF